MLTTYACIYPAYRWMRNVNEERCNTMRTFSLVMRFYRERRNRNMIWDDAPS